MHFTKIEDLMTFNGIYSIAVEQKFETVLYHLAILGNHYFYPNKPAQKPTRELLSQKGSLLSENESRIWHIIRNSSLKYHECFRNILLCMMTNILNEDKFSKYIRTSKSSGCHNICSKFKVSHNPTHSVLYGNISCS